MRLRKAQIGSVSHPLLPEEANSSCNHQNSLDSNSSCNHQSLPPSLADACACACMIVIVRDCGWVGGVRSLDVKLALIRLGRERSTKPAKIRRPATKEEAGKGKSSHMQRFLLNRAGRHPEGPVALLAAASTGQCHILPLLLQTMCSKKWLLEMDQPL